MLEPHPSTEVSEATRFPDANDLQHLERLTDCLESHVNQGEFSAWAVATPRFAVSCFFADEMLPPLEGNCEWPGTLHPRFDLASLTKPLFANALLRSVVDQPDVMLRLPLTELMEKCHTECGLILNKSLKNSTVTLDDLLNHRAGLPPWQWFGRAVGASQPEPELTRHFATLFAKDAVKECYSDVGYFLLTRVIHELAAANIPDWNWARALNDLNSAAGSEFVHASLDGEEARKAIPSYPYISVQDQDFPGNSLAQHDFGVPHDTNANILAGLGVVSGHAGLFGSVIDTLAALPFLAATQTTWENAAAKHSQSRFAMGLDTPSGPQSASSPAMWPLPPDTRLLGHLGYSGTAFWFHTFQESLREAHVLLTNRTASRLVMGAMAVPRLLVVSRVDGFPTRAREADVVTYVLEGKNMKEISNNDAEETIIFHSRSATRLWNRASLRTPPNIHSVRRKVAEQAWAISEK